MIRRNNVNMANLQMAAEALTGAKDLTGGKFKVAGRADVKRSKDGAKLDEVSTTRESTPYCLAVIFPSMSSYTISF